MSDQTQTLTPEKAYEQLHNELHAPVFFQKLASDYGIVPQSDQERADLLQMGAQLRTAFDADQQKQASAGGQSRFSGVLQSLTGEEKRAEEANEQLIKQAAAEAAGIPRIANAVLTLQKAALEAQA